MDFLNRNEIVITMDNKNELEEAASFFTAYVCNDDGMINTVAKEITLEEIDELILELEDEDCEYVITKNVQDIISHLKKEIKDKDIRYSITFSYWG